MAAPAILSGTGHALALPKDIKPEEGSTNEPIQSQTQPQATLCGRMVHHWRVAVASTSLLALLTAICCAIIWNTHMLCIPFGIGALGSLHAMYTAYEIPDLKTFGEHNREYQEYNREHQELNRINASLLDRFKGDLGLFAQGLASHAGNNEKLTGITDELMKVHGTMDAAGGNLAQLISWLKELLPQVDLKAMAEQAKQMELDRSERIKEIKALEEQQKALELSIARLEGQLDVLGGEVKELTKARQGIVEATDALTLVGRRMSSSQLSPVRDDTSDTPMKKA